MPESQIQRPRGHLTPSPTWTLQNLLRPSGPTAAHAGLLLWESCSSVPEVETLPSRVLSSSYSPLHPPTNPISFTTSTDPGAGPVPRLPV